jgi:lambda family phage minor tail protein L
MIFYALDLSECRGKFGQTTNEVFLWCDGVNELGQDITWSGALPGLSAAGYNTNAARIYTRFPAQAQGFDRQGDGTIPRPKIAVANKDGIISSLTREYNDLVGAKLVRVRTFLKYLDGVNFSRGNLLLNSNNINTTSYTVNQCTKDTNNLVTLTDTTDPYIGQLTTGFYTIKNKVFSFGVTASTTTAVGKYLRLYIYSSSIDEVYSTLVGPLTTTPTEYTCSYKFTTSNNQGVQFRVDMEPGPTGGAWAVGNTVTLSKWHSNEGDVLTEYIETTSTKNPNEDSQQYLDRELWIVDRKSTENSAYIEFELTAPYDLVGVKLPRRQCIQNVCTWKYRGTECGYTGTNYFDKNDQSVSLVSQDVCGKRLSSCKARFGTGSAVLPYGGFPAVGLG